MMSQIGEMIFKHESMDRDQFTVSGRSVETWNMGSEMKHNMGGSFRTKRHHRHRRASVCVHCLVLTAVRVSLSAMFGTLGSRLQRLVKHKHFTALLLLLWQPRRPGSCQLPWSTLR